MHWQRLEKPLRQTLSLRTNYAGLLTLLQVLSAGLHIEQINIEMQSENMTVHFVLQDAIWGMSMSKDVGQGCCCCRRCCRTAAQSFYPVA
ncbi:hypothetical protein M5G07_02520 [Serratia symbiotica]|nr:hypothetical protein [Serratia symbiotica]